MHVFEGPGRGVEGVEGFTRAVCTDTCIHMFVCCVCVCVTITNVHI